LISATVAAMTQPYGPPQPPPPGQGPSYNNPQQPQGTNYGQGYGPGYGPPTGATATAPTTATTRGRFNVAAGVLAAIAAVLGVLSLFVFGWYRDNFGSISGGSNTSSQSKFSKIHDALTAAQHEIDSQPQVGKFIHLGISPTYFGWLGYVLIIAAVVLAFVAAAPLGGGVVLVKFLAALVSLAGLGLTFWAIDLINFDAQLRSSIGDTPSGYGDWIKHTSFGAWAMMLAFLLCFIAALLPPKRKAVVTAAEPGRY
jgi:hypothetical protein